MEIVYKLSEVAKDFGQNNKDIIEMLSELTGEQKKHSSKLADDELNMVFEKLTKQYEVESFDEYFNHIFENVQEAKEKKEKEAREQAEKETAAKKAAEEAAAKKKPETQKTAPVQPKQAPHGGQKVNAPEPKKDQKPIVPINMNVAQKPKKEKSADAPLQSNVASRHVIDTRQNTVNIEKYNEKYTEMSNMSGKKMDNVVTKQKLTQKSQQYRGGRNQHFRGKRETESERLKRIEAQRQKKVLVVSIPEEITVSDFAARVKVTAAEVIKKLMALGIMASLNDMIEFDVCELVAMEFNAKLEHEVVVTIEERIIDDTTDEETDLEQRSPVVVVMGHVDHGKTSLLDAIRKTNVTEGEAGGITQHIGAYRVNINDRDITFLDTPGHAAFTSMRARGAQVTDIAILVVAAEDGIMPQTIEAINHAKAAGVSIIVAINKMDKEGANPERVMTALTEHELIPEEWGGDTICVPVSAVTGLGIEKLLEMVVLVADFKELKANPHRAAKGTVIEARLDKGKGPIATVLVQNGTLTAGDIIVAGMAVGRVRVMHNDKGERVETAGPSVPVEITGLDHVPMGGDEFNSVSDERLARELVEQRRYDSKEEQFNAITKVTLDNLFSQMQEGEVKELSIIVKADCQGSVEAVKQSLEKISNEEVRVRVIHGGVGAIAESDVMLANASNAIIVGFNVRPDPVARDNAERDGVDLRMYRIIYDCIEEIESAMKGMLAPKFRDVELGRIEVRQVYKISSVGVIAGCYVLEGKITRAANIRVVRDGIIIAEDKIDSLKRFKDDVKEAATGYECGVGLEKFNDIKEGDVFEAYIIEEYREN